MKKFISIFCLFLMCLATVYSASVQLAWDASPDSTVTGYALYITSTNGTVRQNVGMALIDTVSNLVADVTYSFYVVAYNADAVESVPSNTLLYTPPGTTNVISLSPPIGVNIQKP